MLDDGQIIITDTGDQKLNLAVHTETKTPVSIVSLGDGGGANYLPSPSQIALKGEQIRRQITRTHVADDHAQAVTVEFSANDLPYFTLREIGFHNEAGDLIYLWAGLDIQVRQLGGTDYLLKQVLDFSHIAEGIAFVDAPNDELFDHTLVTALAIVNLQKEQLRQARKLFDLTGSW